MPDVSFPLFYPQPNNLYRNGSTNLGACRRVQQEVDRGGHQQR